MSINAPSSAQVSSATSSSQVGGTSNTDSAKKTSSDSSFKDEMEKVSTTEKSKKDEKTSDKKSEKVEQTSQKDENVASTDNKNPDNGNKQDDNSSQSDQLSGMVDFSNFGSLSVANANSMLTNDIAQMLNINNNVAITGLAANMKVSDSGMMTLNYSTVSMTESDADFFINLTQKNDVSVQNITAQAQNMLNQGVDAKEVKQNVQISETLLNAINIAKENNQPLRVDFDQNISVIMRFGKDGSLAANFIPGNNAVEQYLRNNIETLKSTFKENNLSYSDLSYESRGNKQQKENRRSKQQ